MALCIAPTRAEAEDIAEAVELDLEALPAVIDSLAARRPDALLVHDEWGDNLFLTFSTTKRAKWPSGSQSCNDGAEGRACRGRGDRKAGT